MWKQSIGKEKLKVIFLLHLNKHNQLVSISEQNQNPINLTDLICHMFVLYYRNIQILKLSHLTTPTWALITWDTWPGC